VGLLCCGCGAAAGAVAVAVAVGAVAVVAVVAAAVPVLLRTKHEPEVEDEDRAADEVFEQTVDLGSDERRDGASQAVLKSLQVRGGGGQRCWCLCRHLRIAWVCAQARAAQHDEMMQAVTAYATQALASVDKWDARSSSARLSSGVKSVPSPQERQEAAAAFAALYGGV